MTRYIFALLIILSSCKKDIAEDEILDMTPIEAKGEIIFLSHRIANTGDWGLVLMNADGTNQRLISNKLVRCAPPAVSNDGKKVAFTAYENFHYNLYVIGIDGQNQKLLTTAKEYCGMPAWSPDDSRIAFVRYDTAGGNGNIYTIGADGSNELKLTSQPSFCPEYTPDGTSIVYHEANNNWAGIYKVNTDGSNKRLLTPLNLSLCQPKVSPNGSMIAMTSVDHKGPQIFVMNADGSNLKQLTFTVSSQTWPSPAGLSRDGNIEPVWSPNSEKLAYVSYENNSPDIFTINANGTGNRRLTDTPKRDESPCWTSDGKYIIFSSNRTVASSEIYIMRTEGQLQTYLTTFMGNDIYPIFISK